MNSENSTLPEIVYIIRFRNGMFLSLLDAETPNDYEAMVFDTREIAEKSFAKLPDGIGAEIVAAPLDEYKCPAYVPPPVFVLVRSLVAHEVSPDGNPYMFIGMAGTRTNDVDKAMTFSSANAAYLAKADYSFASGYYVAEKGKLDEVAPRKL